MMNNKKEILKSEMLEKIRTGAAWFTTRPDFFIMIGYDETDKCYCARECEFRDGRLEGGAYTFGTDWFDISFHGRYIDIYVDPETFRRWPVFYDAERGTRYEDADQCAGQAERVLKFCRQADREALAGGLDAYKIDGANFAHIIELSDNK